MYLRATCMLCTQARRDRQYDGDRQSLLGVEAKMRGRRVTNLLRPGNAARHIFAHARRGRDWPGRPLAVHPRGRQVEKAGAAGPRLRGLLGRPKAKQGSRVQPSDSVVSEGDRARPRNTAQPGSRVQPSGSVASEGDKASPSRKTRDAGAERAQLCGRPARPQASRAACTWERALPLKPRHWREATVCLRRDSGSRSGRRRRMIEMGLRMVALDSHARGGRAYA